LYAEVIMKLSQPDADVFVPDGAPLPEALARTTHLCVGAHPDDQEFMALHGILECFGRKDRGFTGVVVTDGAGSPRAGEYARCSNDEMVQIRQREQRKAAVVGEYACQIQLMFPSAAVKGPGNRAVVDDLAAIFEASHPRVVYLHNPADKHDGHVACCLRAVDALRRLPKDRRPETVYGCEIWRDLDWLCDADKRALPVDAHPNLAAALSGVFDSQIAGGKRYDAAVQGRRLAHATFHEPLAVDKAAALSFAMDLTPLVRDDGLSVTDYALGFIRRFEAEVMDRLRKLCVSERPSALKTA
jgi:LmbE family N-acetylglucosaminyl deacetylase